jgi:hypothetical protein
MVLQHTDLLHVCYSKAGIRFCICELRHACSIGYGDVTAGTGLELWMSMMVLVIGLAFLGTLITSYKQVLQLDCKEAQKKAVSEKLVHVRNWMATHQVESGLHSKALWFYVQHWHRDRDLADILGMLFVM